MIVNRWQLNTAQPAPTVPTAAAVPGSASTATLLCAPEELLEELKRLPAAWLNNWCSNATEAARCQASRRRQSCRTIELLKVMLFQPGTLATLHEEIHRLKGTRE